MSAGLIRWSQIEQSYFKFLLFAPAELTCLVLPENLVEKIRTLPKVGSSMSFVDISFLPQSDSAPRCRGACPAGVICRTPAGNDYCPNIAGSVENIFKHHEMVLRETLGEC
jgi:hypothetical protein